MSKYAKTVYTLYPKNRSISDEELSYLRSLGEVVSKEIEPKFNRLDMQFVADYVKESIDEDDPDGRWSLVRELPTYWFPIFMERYSDNPRFVNITFNEVMTWVAGKFPVMEGMTQEVRSLFEDYLDRSNYEYTVCSLDDPKCLYDCRYYLSWRNDKHWGGYF